jgi:hypothetical protein
VIQGRFLQVPEGPADMRKLWDAASPLEPASLPSWLTVEDTAGYRHVGAFSTALMSTDEQHQLRQELDQCQSCGMIVDGDPFDPHLQHLFLSAPQKEAIWSIGLFHGPSPLELQPMPSVAQPVLTQRDVTDVSAVFIADPFLARTGDDWHLFFEVMNWRTCKGEIGHAVSSNGRDWVYDRIVLAEPFHLSYPLVFEWDQTWYMVPESYQAGGVLLYQAVDFPVCWRCLGPLLRGPYLADTTLLRHAGRWWLFTDTSKDFANDTLRLFHAAELRGPWQEHPCSPVVEGRPTLARPAGRVVSIGERLFRLAQSCVPHYGTDVRAVEIEQLTPTEYREREHPGGPILRPTPGGWSAGGMHHLDAQPVVDGYLAVVDGWCWS